MMNNKIWFDER